MKVNAIFAAALFSVVNAFPIEERQNAFGPYGSVPVSTDNGLPNHAIYIPSSTAATDKKWPVVVWGNGGCGGDGASNRVFLSWLASYGYLAIASGRPGGSGSTTAQMMKESIDFAVRVGGTAGRYANVDSSKIFASGFSCGGVEAMAQSWDSRVSTIGVISSGLLTNYSAAATYTKPVLFVIGGSGDVAYNNAERDFRALPATTPSWKGNLNLGHGGDLFGNNGGKFGKAQLLWLEWLFRGDAKAGEYFTANGWQADGWAVQTKALNLLKPFV